MPNASEGSRLAVAASLDAVEPVARVIEDGGIAAIAWGHPRRAIYALLARADSAAATLRLNRIKGRPPEQVLAVVGATAVARLVADLSPPSAVGRIAAANGVNAEALLDGLYRTGPVALMLDALDTAPPAIVKTDASGRARVLVVGEEPAVEPDNFYDQLIDYLLTERGVLVAGSSGNRSGHRTYTTWDFAAAEGDFAGDVAVFVRPRLPIPARRRWDAPVSCSGFDLTTPEATLIRHGSLHPDVFRAQLPRYVTSPLVHRIDGRQGALAGVLERAMPVR